MPKPPALLLVISFLIPASTRHATTPGKPQAQQGCMYCTCGIRLSFCAKKCGQIPLAATIKQKKKLMYEIACDFPHVDQPKTLKNIKALKNADVPDMLDDTCKRVCNPACYANHH